MAVTKTNFEATIDATSICLRGAINELVVPEDLSLHIQSLFSHLPEGEIYVDLSELTYANSVGLRTWMDIIQKQHMIGWYTLVPEWFIHQINFIPNLTNNGQLLVYSFMAPFLVSTTNEVVFHPLTIGNDVPILDSYEDYFVPTPKSEQPITPDFEPCEYFGFILNNLNEYRKRQGKRHTVAPH